MKQIATIAVTALVSSLIVFSPDCAKNGVSSNDRGPIEPFSYI
jgi:hypothetical protein